MKWLWLVLLIACARDSRQGDTLSLGELLLVAEVAGSYQNWFPASEECLAKLPESRVVVANRDQMIDLCWRDEPGRCAAGESRSKYGCAAGCLDVQSVCGFLDHDCDTNYAFVVSEKATGEEYLGVIKHEALHAIGHCHRNPLGTRHDYPFYQILEGQLP